MFRRYVQNREIQNLLDRYYGYLLIKGLKVMVDCRIKQASSSE